LFRLKDKVANTTFEKKLSLHLNFAPVFFYHSIDSFIIFVMSEGLGFRAKNPSTQAKIISQLERQFSTITQLLYTTSVPGALLDRQVLPYIADDIIFKDPWQEGGSKQLYRIGMKGN
jgi:hypothetical protein